jgi:hypothetical protein
MQSGVPARHIDAIPILGRARCVRLARAAARHPCGAVEARAAGLTSAKPCGAAVPRVCRVAELAERPFHAR